MQKKQSGFSKTWLLGFKITMAILVFWLLLHNSQLNFSLLSVFWTSPALTLLIMLLCYIMVVAHAWRWYRLNRVQGIDLSFMQTIMPTYLGVAFNTVLPGSLGGDFVRLYFVIKKFPQKKTRAVFSVLVDRISGLLGLFIIGSFIAPYYMHVYAGRSGVSSIFFISTVVCVGALAVFALLMLLSAEKVGFLSWLIRMTEKYPLLRPLTRVLEAVALYQNAKWTILESLAVSIFTQLLLLVVLVIISDMMQLPAVSMIDYMLALVVAQVANLVPLTPGGVGMGEAAFANIIEMVHPGVAGAYATVFFAVRVISALAYFPGVLIGIFGDHLYGKVSESEAVDAI